MYIQTLGKMGISREKVELVRPLPTQQKLTLTPHQNRQKNSHKMNSLPTKKLSRPALRGALAFPATNARALAARCRWPLDLRLIEHVALDWQKPLPIDPCPQMGCSELIAPILTMLLVSLRPRIAYN